MLEDVKRYIEDKYKLNCNLSIDLKIESDNVLDTITITTLEDAFVIRYDNLEINSSKKTIYRDISFLLDHLSYIYFLTFEGKEVCHITFDALHEDTIIDCAENFLWEHRDDNMEEIDRIFVISFRNLYSFEAKVSGSFVDTYWQIYDEPHYNVMNAAMTTFKYRDKNYAERYKSLCTLCINNSYNMLELRKYFLQDGYAYLLDWKDEDRHDVYEIIDIDIDNIKTTAGDKFVIMSADYSSILDYEDGNIYLRGRVADIYPTESKILQVDDEPCQYIHSIKTSRVLYNGKLYEASGKTRSDELNKLNSLLDKKILCCFFCKYGNYIDDEEKIYCLNGFNPKSFVDVLFDVEESKMIPYDMFNLCEDFNFQSKQYYTHTKAKGDEDNE